MSRIADLWKAESARIMSILLALVAVGVIPGTAGKILGAVLPVLGGQAVRSTVWAPTTVEAAVTTAATSVASQLTPETTGPAGMIPPAAQVVVDGVVSAVVDS